MSLPLLIFSNSTSDQKEEMKTSVRIPRIGFRRFALLRFLALGVFSCVSLIAAGCGSSDTVKPVVKTFTFTDANGKTLTDGSGNPLPPPVSLQVNQNLYLMVTVADDTALLGADWSVACASALPPGTPLPPGQTQDLSCGSFVPAHSMSGPIPPTATVPTGYIVLYTAPASVPKGGTVTLRASATTDQSRFLTLTLNILP